MSSNKILIVDDSPTILSILRSYMMDAQFINVFTAGDYHEAKGILDNDTDYFMAILDLNLPDAPNGEIVDLFLSHNIPSVVMTGNYNEDQRLRFEHVDIVDYVLKDSPSNLDYIVKLVKRVYENQWVSVLIVDDSKFIRNKYKELLEVHNYNVLTAEDGQQALYVLGEHSRDIRLVLTDYNMPVMDGFSLVSNIRKKYSKEDVSIIGLSGGTEYSVSAKFLKLGANDFLAKSFIKEEFYARVTQNIENLDMIRRLKDMAMRDHLTGLYNRRYFFVTAEKQINDAKTNGGTFYVAMIDIDFFKKVNDTYGHQAGDSVIRVLADELKKVFSDEKRYSVARFGGEEFIVISSGSAQDGDYIEKIEALRKNIESFSVESEGKNIKFTISIGVALHNDEKNLEHMIKDADDCLYIAKENGRNRIVVG